MIVRSIVINQYGGPEVLQVKEISLDKPGPDEALVTHSVIGLNFIDIYQRKGLYPLAKLPSVIGSEAAGRVQAIGSRVTEVSVGDRVAYAGGPPGSYSEARIISAQRLVRLPEGISDSLAAAIMLKGMTAEYLLRRCYAVQAGDIILLHSAAGGVGLLVCQWAKMLGATVIGTVSNHRKALVAVDHGCDHVIIREEEDFVARVSEITHGNGVPVVYDSIGKETFMRSLDCIKPRGIIVSFGQSSGMVPPFDITNLSIKGSLYLTRPTLMHYTASREDLLNSASAVFDSITRGAVKIKIGQTYPLRDASQAHIDLERGNTVGSTILIP